MPSALSNTTDLVRTSVHEAYPVGLWEVGAGKAHYMNKCVISHLAGC